MSYYSLCGELRLLIHRVELKLDLGQFLFNQESVLLIHRVELKQEAYFIMRPYSLKLLIHRVELKRIFFTFYSLYRSLLLIHRVELKLSPLCSIMLLAPTVANPPCGVETIYREASGECPIVLLIHRVELKLPLGLGRRRFRLLPLLIHRVELKPFLSPMTKIRKKDVANPPCGVETTKAETNEEGQGEGC